MHGGRASGTGAATIILSAAAILIHVIAAAVLAVHSAAKWIVSTAAELILAVHTHHAVGAVAAIVRRLNQPADKAAHHAGIGANETLCRAAGTGNADLRIADARRLAGAEARAHLTAAERAARAAGLVTAHGTLAERAAGGGGVEARTAAHSHSTAAGTHSAPHAPAHSAASTAAAILRLHYGSTGETDCCCNCGDLKMNAAHDDFLLTAILYAFSREKRSWSISV